MLPLPDETRLPRREVRQTVNESNKECLARVTPLCSGRFRPRSHSSVTRPPRVSRVVPSRPVPTTEVGKDDPWLTRIIEGLVGEKRLLILCHGP